MFIEKVGKHVYLVDVRTAGITNFIASYVLIGKRVAIVESGPTSSTPNLILGLKELHVKPEDVAYVAVSHVHLDHGGGAGTLLKHLPKAEVVVHRVGVPHLANPNKLWQQSKKALRWVADAYGKPEPVPEDRIVPATDGVTLEIGSGVELRAVETTGHASHHLSYYEPLNEGVFAGDAAGIYLSDVDAVVPTTPAPFKLDMALASLDKLANLRPRFLYYSHFGVTRNAVDRLNAYANQLRIWADVIRLGVERGHSLDKMVEMLVENDGALRKAKKHVEAHDVLSETVLVKSVQGFVEFIKMSEQR